MALDVFAAVVFMTRALLPAARTCCAPACAAAVVGVWVEKGMGLVIPGFVPSPLGEIVDYTPSFTEFCVSAGDLGGRRAHLHAAAQGGGAHRARHAADGRAGGGGAMKPRAARALAARGAALALARAATRPQRPRSRPVEPPVASPSAIPDAPVSGTIRGAQFVAARRALRRRSPRRLRAHRHQALGGKGRGAVRPDRARARRRACGCGSTASTRSPRRSCGSAPTGASPARWSVHYQVFEARRRAVTGRARAKTALLVLRGGRRRPALGRPRRVLRRRLEELRLRLVRREVSCPPQIDQPVRGTPPPESIPKEYLERLLVDGGVR